MPVQTIAFPEPCQINELKAGEVFCSYGEEGQVAVNLAVMSDHLEQRPNVVGAIVLGTVSGRPVNEGRTFEFKPLGEFSGLVGRLAGFLRVFPGGKDAFGGEEPYSPLWPTVAGPAVGQLMISAEFGTCLISPRRGAKPVAYTIQHGATVPTGQDCLYYDRFKLRWAWGVDGQLDGWIHGF